MIPPSRRLVILGGIAVVLAVIVGWRFIGGSGGSDDPFSRIDALEAAGDVDGLAREISNPNVKIARLAVLALGRIGGDQAVGQVVKAMKDIRPPVREAAAGALGQAGGEEQIPILAGAAAEDKAAIVRATALRALGRLRAYTQMEVMLEALDDPDEPVRRCANAAIEKVVGVKVGYRASDSPPRRQQAIARWQATWERIRAKTEAFYKNRARYRKQRGR